ncbi:MAG: tetratricopeptide repeat protein [Pleurocapsa sp. MO_192.B19]|nr:tetratricopeptide repeat protein [Pleurocapsa sp. MO_192.B19]
MNQLSLSQLNPDQIEQAIAKYVEQIASSPQPAVVHANLGNLYAQQKRWREALTCYEQAIKINPDFAEAYRNLAKILTQLDEEQQAAEHLCQAFKLKPDSATAKQHYDLGQTLQSYNKPGRAIACYRRAIESQPDFLAAYQNLGNLLLQQGKEEHALTIYRQGVKQNRQNPQFHLALGQALASGEKWFQANNSYQTAWELDPNIPELYYHWGVTLIQIEQSSQAQECYQKAIALQADYWQAYYQLGLLWQNQKQWHQAIAAYRKVRAINPQFTKVLVNLGLVYRHLSQYDLAIACYREAVKTSPEKSPLETEAVAGYQETLKKHPQATVTLYYRMAKLLRAKGRFPDAIAMYQKSLELEPNFKSAYIDLQYTPIASEQLTELIKFYRQIVTQHPDIPIAWGNLGDALTQQDRISEAIDCYRTGSYQQAIQTYPDLAKLNWKEKKESGPDFIIAGASKSGTSSIYYYLSRHPQVLLSHKKEIDFYWKNFDRGIDWYLAHFPPLTDREDFLTGEATPNYLRFPQVAQRIKDTFPQVKIIILLRNPVDRAISWHYHKVNSGLTNTDLDTALALEIKRLATVSETEIINTGFYNPDNILSSLYIYKIKAWIELLGRKQFLILQSEDFYSNPLKNMEKVCEFLGLPNSPLDNYPKVNAGSYNQVNSRLRKTLTDYFAPYNQQLEEYLGIEFNWQ